MARAEGSTATVPTPVDGTQRVVDVGEAKCLVLQRDGVGWMGALTAVRGCTESIAL